MIHDICKDIIAHLQIDRFIETGTFVGETLARVSSWFKEIDPEFGTIGEWVPHEYLNSFYTKRTVQYPVFINANPDARTKIYSVDVDGSKQQILATLFANNPNIKFICSSSERFIKQVFDNGVIHDKNNCLFFLDAHWVKYWPLRDEIREILRLRHSVIVIDDFAIPFRYNIGFDMYKNNACEWNYIKDLFKGKDAKIYYPKKPNIDNHSIVIIFIGYSEEELVFMKQLPCYNPFIKGDPFIRIVGLFFTVVLPVIVAFLRKIRADVLVRKVVFKLGLWK